MKPYKIRKILWWAFKLKNNNNTSIYLCIKAIKNSFGVKDFIWKVLEFI